jgi:diguanylate cyclase (GGDEF)-like protein/PAS domain S-box-containing protein
VGVPLQHDESPAFAEGQGARIDERLDALLSITGRMDGFLYRCRNDASYTMLYMSEGVRTVSGYPVDDFTNNSVREYVSVIHPDDLAHVYSAVDTALAAGRNWHVDYRIMPPLGEPVWVREIGGGVLNEAGDLLFLEGFVFDISDRKVIEDRNVELLAELRSANEALSMQKEAIELAKERSDHSANHDALTGLPNRTFFNDELARVLSQRQRAHERAALMFLDLDRFKQVNDTLGHAAGDVLIKELSTRLQAVLRPNDVLARMGGDEFAIIRPNPGTRQDVENFCREIMAAATKPFEVLGAHAAVGISIGVAISPDVGVDSSELARKADIALYQAKKSGRHCFQFFTEEMSDALFERHALEVDLRLALDAGKELEVVYQPVYSAQRLDITGVEALLRWHHPRLGSVPPPLFIALAEECGLIERLGEWALRQACNAAAAWNIPTVAVNASPSQILQPEFASRVLKVLAETGLSPTRLEIEITESTLLESSGTSSKVLKTLRGAGVRIALDDFGTGYSSLSYLIKLEVDRLKIDRSFVQPLTESSASCSIVQAIVTMAHAVGISVTAEGVETREQQEILTKIGCNNLQGYLLSRPGSAASLAKQLTPGELRSRLQNTEAA